MTPSSTKPWWKSAIIYEVYVDKFADNFNGLTQKLDYLKLLGINCIHVLPHYPSPMIDDRYDISDYTGIRQELGTLEDFKIFAKSAHDLGIKVIVDFVLNHTSTQHLWFVEVSSSTTNNKRDYYFWSKTGTELKKARNVFSNLKPSNWIYNKATDDYFFSTFYPKQADLNWDNQEVFDEMTKIMDFWMDIGVDGFRLDAASHIVKKEGTGSEDLPETHVLVKKIRAHIEKKRDDVVLVAEVNESIEKTKEYFGNGDECHLIYNFPVAGQVFLALINNKPKNLDQFIKTLKDIPKNCSWLNFLRHHDEMSLKTVSEKEREKLLQYFDPERKHLFGTKGISMRITTMFKQNKEKIIESFKLLFSVLGAKVVYYGDEIGMENIEIPAEEKDTRKALRGKFDWDSANKQILDSESLFMSISNIIKNKKV